MKQNICWELYLSGKKGNEFHLIFDEKPFFSSENYIVFGNPITSDLEKSLLLKKYFEIDGFYFIVFKEANDIFFVTDICAGYKVYYKKKNKKTILCNSIRLLDQLENLVLSEESSVLSYFHNHLFLPWNYTPFKNINVFPAAIVTDLWEFTSYLSEIGNPSYNLYDALHKQIRLIKGKTILMFSGGRDSMLLAAIMMEAGINFDLVYLESSSPYAANQNDRKKAVNGARYLRMKLKIIRVSLITALSFPDFFTEMFPHQHFSLLHMAGCKTLKNIYGSEITIVNGQSADSMLSLGPSNRNIQDFIRRLSFNKKLRVFLTPIIPIINYFFRLNLKFLVKKNDYEKSIIDERRYFFLKSDVFASYDLFLEKVVQLIKVSHKNWDTRHVAMILKLHSFLQGSDNQVVVMSAKFFGIKRVIMPFASSSVFYLSNPTSVKSLFFPKFEVYDTLRRIKTLNYSPYDSSSLEIIDTKPNSEGCITDFNTLSFQVLEIYKKLEKKFHRPSASAVLKTRVSGGGKKEQSTGESIHKGLPHAEEIHCPADR